MSVLKPTEMYTLNGRILWYVNYISIKIITLLLMLVSKFTISWVQPEVELLSNYLLLPVPF